MQVNVKMPISRWSFARQLGLELGCLTYLAGKRLQVPIKLRLRVRDLAFSPLHCTIRILMGLEAVS
jgi:hypothetical protein